MRARRGQEPQARPFRAEYFDSSSRVATSGRQSRVESPAQSRTVPLGKSLQALRQGSALGQLRCVSHRLLPLARLDWSINC